MNNIGPTISLKDMKVVKTKEVRVERSERDISDMDVESFGEGSLKGQGDGEEGECKFE
jgi:hypothetical protein